MVTKSMRFTTIAASCLMLCTIQFTAQAGSPRGGSGSNDSLECPDKAVTSMDTEFGLGTSDLTSCIQKRENLATVIAWNLASTNGRTGLAQQVQVTRNMMNNWENMYGMTINKDFVVTAIGYAGGGRWLLTDEAYNRTYSVTTGNPTRATTESLIARGVSVYMCQNTMRGNKWVTSDLISGVKMVPSGAVSIIDYEHRGYKYINP